LTASRRALLLLPALAACYVYAPLRWAAAEPPRGDWREERTAPRAPAPEEPPLPSRLDSAEPRARIVEVARRYLGQRFAGDCSAFVRRVMREAEVELGPLPSAHSMTESIHLATRPVRRPHSGDLVFFHDTYDRNRDGRLGDDWTHVALVEEVDGERVSILHRGGRGIVRLRMDLAHPHDDRDNDAVRVRAANDPPGTRYLTGELFAGYGAAVE